MFIVIIYSFLLGAKSFPQLSLIYGMLAKFLVDLLVEKVTTETNHSSLYYTTTCPVWVKGMGTLSVLLEYYAKCYAAECCIRVLC